LFQQKAKIMLPLKTTLTINAVSSGATGILLIAFAKTIAALFGIAQIGPFIGTGVFLLVFATYVFVVATKNPADPRSVKLITALDLLWVLASAIAIVTGYTTLSGFGVFAIAAVAAWVAGMAFLQSKGIRAEHGVR
jgi:hypothetical protein